MAKSDFSELVKGLRKGFSDGVLHDMTARKSAVRAVHNLVDENQAAIIEACMKDLKRPKAQTVISEICALKKEANTIHAHMEEWLKDEHVSRSFISLFDTPYIQRQPLGVVLIFGSWNYPFLMVLQPLVGALAAGNTAVIKPSEHAPSSAALLAELMAKYLSKDICQVVCGDLKVSQSLLASERFDYVFYTGGQLGAKAVYTAAAAKLTPVTMELGGKCPVYVDERSDVKLAAQRILWSKIFNAGQTCLAVDHVLCHKHVQDEFQDSLKRALDEFLGDKPQSNPDYPRIINKSHFNRLSKLLTNSKGKVLFGGDTDESDLYIAPTAVADVTLSDCLMSEELFGPILPIISVKSAAEAVDIVRNSEKPLALYVFTSDSNVFSLFKHGTFSGSLSQNDVMSHVLLSELPFGGVGNSGFGSYHGKYSLETFSHRRSILLKSTLEYFNTRTVYPPYNESKISWSQWLLSKSDRKGCSMM